MTQANGGVARLAVQGSSQCHAASHEGVPGQELVPASRPAQADVEAGLA
jgi:hypothetical protein